MADDTDKVLERVRKLLALATSSNEHEAAAAMAKAQALMAEHGLTEAKIRLSDIGHADIKSQFSVSRMKKHELVLMNCIGKAFTVKILWKKSSSYADDVFGTFTVVGRKANVQVAEHIAIVLGRKLRAARADFVRTLPRGTNKTKEADGFCLGWVYAIAKKVSQIAMDDQTSRLVDEYAEKTFTLTGEAKAQERKVGAAGFQLGKLAGDREGLYRPMEQGQQQAGIGVTHKIGHG